MENKATDILTRDKSGDTIRLDDPKYPALFKIIQKAIRTTAKLNSIITDDLQEINTIFSELIGKKVDDTFFIIPPFYSDFGENINILVTSEKSLSIKSKIVNRVLNIFFSQSMIVNKLLDLLKVD